MRWISCGHSTDVVPWVLRRVPYRNDAERLRHTNLVIGTEDVVSLAIKSNVLRHSKS